ATIECCASRGHLPISTQRSLSAACILPKPFPTAHLRMMFAAPHNSTAIDAVKHALTTFSRTAAARLSANKIATFGAPNSPRLRAIGAFASCARDTGAMQGAGFDIVLYVVAAGAVFVGMLIVFLITQRRAATARHELEARIEDLADRL